MPVAQVRPGETARVKLYGLFAVYPNVAVRIGGGDVLECGCLKCGDVLGGDLIATLSVAAHGLIVVSAFGEWPLLHVALFAFGA